MGRGSRKVLFMVLALLLVRADLIFAGGGEVFRPLGIESAPPAPRLRYPVTDKVVLESKDFVEFGWWNDFIRIDRYLFKIYKGYDMYGPDLVFKEDLRSDKDSFKVKADVFRQGQVYTWSLVAVARSGQKSQRSTQSFRVIRR